MNTFKRKALMSAVLGTLGAAGSAEAVYINPNNTGQVLYYPYYTVQSQGGNAYNTLLSVVNTTTSVKVIKVPVAGQPGQYMTGLLPVLPSSSSASASPSY